MQPGSLESLEEGRKERAAGGTPSCPCKELVEGLQWLILKDGGQQPEPLFTGFLSPSMRPLGHTRPCKTLFSSNSALSSVRAFPLRVYTGTQNLPTHTSGSQLYIDTQMTDISMSVLNIQTCHTPYSTQHTLHLTHNTTTLYTLHTLPTAHISHRTKHTIDTL